MKKKLTVSLAFSVFIYLFIVLFIGPKDLLSAIKKVTLISLLSALMIIIASLFFEFLRWKYYLKVLDIRIGTKKSLEIFMSGLSLGFMPAKSGELLRYFLLKRNKVPYKKTIPIHFVSNISVLLVVLAFSNPFLILIANMEIFYTTLVLIIIFFFSFRFPAAYLRMISAIQKRINIRLLSDLKRSILYSKKLLGTRQLIISLSLTVIYYSMMAIVFYFIASNFQMDIPWYVAFAIYSLSLIIGVLSLLPGGIGAVEGSAIILLMNHMEESSAVALVLIMRILSLWFTILLGVVALNFSIFRDDLYSNKLDSVF